MLKIGWFSSGNGTGSQKLLKTILEHIDSNSLNANISFVFCNWDNTEVNNPKKNNREVFFKIVKQNNIPLITFSSNNFKPELRRINEDEWRNQYGNSIRERISDYDFDLIILAGYMLWLDDAFCQSYTILNLHPALPDGPKGTWQNVIWNLIKYKCDKHGITIHLCTPERDRGKPIAFCSFPITGKDYDELWSDFIHKQSISSFDDIKNSEGINNPLFQKIRNDGIIRENPLLIATIKMISENHLLIESLKYDSNKNAEDLTDSIDYVVKSIDEFTI